MTRAKKLNLLSFAYLLVLTVLGRLIFTFPNQTYLGILNHDDYYVLSMLLVLASALVIYFLSKGSPMKKTLAVAVASFFIFAGVAVYYYANLPAYTYEEAAKKVEAFEKQSGKSVRVEVPDDRYYKVGIRKHTFLKMTNHVYYIYLEVEGDPVTYRFNPLDGQFEPLIRNIELESEFRE